MREISLAQLVFALSEAIDLVDPAVADHHKRVAYGAFHIGRELGLSRNDLDSLVMAASLHDIGAISLRERLDVQNFEIQGAHEHAFKGAKLFSIFTPLKSISEIIKFHHVHWRSGEGRTFYGEKVPLASHIVHLADRVCVQIGEGAPVLSQAPRILETIRERKNSMFAPDPVSAFESVAAKEAFWFDLVSPSLRDALTQEVKLKIIALDMGSMLEMTEMFSQVIDFRSRFTATHSSGVAACAGKLAELAGLSRTETQLLRVTGNLHDLGKFSIPESVLNKPTALSADEYNIVKGHPYFTYAILGTVDGLSDVQAWGSFHHENLDGKGYPFHKSSDELSSQARIVAVADAFTALTEDRPYRMGLGTRSTIRLIKRMAKSGKLDKDIVGLVSQDSEGLDFVRSIEQKSAERRYQDFSKTPGLSEDAA